MYARHLIDHPKKENAPGHEARVRDWDLRQKRRYAPTCNWRAVEFVLVITL